MEGMSGDLYNGVVGFLRGCLKGGDIPSYLFLMTYCICSSRNVLGLRCLMKIACSLEFGLVELGVPEQNGPGRYHRRYLLPLSELGNSTIKTGFDARILLSSQC